MNADYKQESDPMRYLGGISLVVVAISILIVGWNYPTGSLSQMGPGYFPKIVGVLMLLFGILCLYNDYAHPVEPDEEGGVHWRNLIFLAASVLTFAALVDRAGLVPAIFLAVVISIFADRAARPLDAVIYAAFVTFAAWTLFIPILGLPMTAFGRG